MSVLVIPEFENDDEQLLEPENVIAQSVPDERANIPVSETTERFLRAVLVKVPLERIEELHLFSPLRQGTAETGIAVIAARVMVADQPERFDLQLQLEAGPDVEVDEDEPAEVAGIALGAEAVAHEESTEAVQSAEGLENVNPGEGEAAQALGDETDGGEASAELAILTSSDETVVEDDHDDSPYADEPSPAAAEDVLNFAHELAPDVADELSFDPPVPRVRHTVYTARYRLVIKGPDRGKWEMDVVDEADAPLLAVETVVRGVQRRAGEETATVRYDASQLARVLRITVPQLL